MYILNTYLKKSVSLDNAIQEGSIDLAIVGYDPLPGIPCSTNGKHMHDFLGRFLFLFSFLHFEGVVNKAIDHKCLWSIE